jgi:hypothetical protein
MAEASLYRVVVFHDWHQSAVVAYEWLENKGVSMGSAINLSTLPKIASLISLYRPIRIRKVQ